MTSDGGRWGDAGRQTVGVCLMKTEEGEATVAYLSERAPQLRIQDRGAFYLVEGEGEIRIGMPEVSEYLGRDLPVHTFLVTMSSYYGRVHLDEDAFVVSAAMDQLENRDAS
ncbi:MAG: MmoB/DmpM family protein [Actinomycetota bacterium]